MEEVMRQAGFLVHGKESTTTLIKRFEKSRKKMIVCFDECDYMKEPDILGVFARNLCGLILISNQASFSKIDHSVKNRLFFNEIEFKPYNSDEILAILKERVSYGFRPGAISDALLSIVSKVCNGDVRTGLQTLKMAANEAESKYCDRVTINEIRNAAKRTRKYRNSFTLHELNPYQRTILSILKENKKMRSGELYK